MFVPECIRAFRPLVDTHGFDPPEVKDYGREVFVEYHRGLSTVSVSYESGAEPIIELFYPPAPGEHPVAWGRRNGSPRTRRVLSIGLRSQSPSPGVSLADHLNLMFQSLAEQEPAFLS
jgi:hypothetical protein